MKMTIIVFFVLKQVSEMRHTIKELEEKLSTAAEKYKEFERDVSLFDKQHRFSLHMLTSLFPEFQLEQDEK